MENERSKNQAKRGLWKPEEDLILRKYVETHGEGNWAAVSEKSGMYYVTEWSLIAGRLPGRTDNEVKNYWNTHLNKKLCRSGKRKGLDELGSHQHVESENSQNLQLLCESQTICSASKELDINGRRNIEEEKEQKTRYTDNNWTEEKYEMENGGVMLPPDNNALFVFDDEPFITYLDSFVLFDEMAMQSIMHGPPSTT
ncbi:hypothetical protein JRO89_XS04G0256100 [Xanthoceras sorbifolium]|uniref:Uncharacterized protein n=1 Tax=Xanthoceras sorbifolium TaxID=99658 RepID=A0ABQ8I739_9ROSI|nr:hypothetical protein JRO89_XS04G0256100 [Xanthoceras sorbifolium]